MKTYKHLYEAIEDPEIVARCALDAAEGKLKRSEVQRFFTDFDNSCEYVQQCAADPDYNPCEDNQHCIIDGANNKSREIEKPRFCPEQVLHHLLIEGFKPVLLNGLYEQVYGCLPPSRKLNSEGRLLIKRFGPHAAIKQLTKWTQINTKVYVCETDVHHAYGSVHIGTLVRQMQEVIKDERWMRLTCKFLHYNPNDPEREKVYGLILGHYTSPWFFNFYLKTFDHFMASFQEVHYLRFADNMFLVGTNKRKVHRALEVMADYLKTYLQLDLNDSTQVYRFEYLDKNTGKVYGRAVNALGAVIHYNRVTLRKSILERMRRKANKIHDKGPAVTWHDGASYFARISWTRHTDVWKYYEKNIKNKVNSKRLKRKVKKHGKVAQKIAQERRRIVNAGLENSTRFPGDSAK